MKIKLTLVLSVILESIKTETHIKGQVDRAIDDKNAKVAYQEEIGDEEFHERKLMRTIFNAVDNLKGELAHYVINANATTGDNIVSTIDEANDQIILELNVSESFNKGMTDTLARLCSKYIEDASLTLWWGTFNPNQAKFYIDLQMSDVSAIGKCFVRTAPKKAVHRYTQNLSLSGSTFDVAPNDTFTITYTLDEGAIDDIEIFSPHHVHFERGVDNDFFVTVHHEGIFKAKLYSLHNEDIFEIVTIRCSK